MQSLLKELISILEEIKIASGSQYDELDDVIKAFAKMDSISVKDTQEEINRASLCVIAATSFAPYIMRRKNKAFIDYCHKLKPTELVIPPFLKELFFGETVDNKPALKRRIDTLTTSFKHKATELPDNKPFKRKPKK